MASLFVIQGPDQGKRFELKEGSNRGAFVIGRDSANLVRLVDSEVSRRHAEIQAAGDGPSSGLRIVDLGSANGTFVNGKAAAQAALRPGDQIRLGQTVLLFNDSGPRGDRELWSRVELSSRSNPEDRSAILKSVPPGEGSRVLQSPETAGDWLKVRLANLATLYQATMAVSHILDLDVLLDQILQLAFESLAADRGVVLMLKDDGDLEPRAVRWRGVIKPEDRFSVSRTIVDHVLQHGQGVITLDAPADRRFAEAKSVLNFGIREAVCVPIQGRHSTYGVLYIDARALSDQHAPSSPSSVNAPSPSPPSTQASGPNPAAGPLKTKLTKDHLTLMAAIGHQAGLAVENTKFHEDKIEAERLAAVGQAIATLSHHIKNILQGIRGGSYLIQTGLDGQDETAVRKGWRIVEKNQNKIYDLVMDMLSFSKEREPSWDCNNLNTVMADVIELMASRAEEQGVRLIWSPNPGLPDFLFDEEGLHRAILNLVTNALDAVAHTPEATVRAQASREGPMIRVVVEDNGPGIPEAELQSIFKIFASTKGSRGTGLGLPVSEKIVREHGGSIRVESQVGQGTRFIMELPIRDCEDADSTLGAPL